MMAEHRLSTSNMRTMRAKVCAMLVTIRDQDAMRMSKVRMNRLDRVCGSLNRCVFASFGTHADSLRLLAPCFFCLEMRRFASVRAGMMRSQLLAGALLLCSLSASDGMLGSEFRLAVGGRFQPRAAYRPRHCMEGTCVCGEMLRKVPLQKQDQDFLVQVCSVMQYVTFGAVRPQLSKNSSLLGSLQPPAILILSPLAFRTEVRPPHPQSRRICA